MQKTPNTHPDSESAPVYVNANTVAVRYGVTPRYILKLAAEGTIPCLRLGPQCVRFSITAVAEALEDQLASDHTGHGMEPPDFPVNAGHHPMWTRPASRKTKKPV